MKQFVVYLAISLGGLTSCFAQNTDTSKHLMDNTVHIYFIISAGDQINAYYNDKPLEVETISQFNDYVQANVKKLKDSWVVVTGKPKVGTFDEVLKTLNHFRFKHVSKNILAN
jgi:hypothetical protein